MMFRNRLIGMTIVLGLAISSTSYAETISVERSSSINLTTLTKSVYARYISSQKQRAQEQRITANNDLANAAFAGPANINLNHHNDVVGSSDGFQEWEGSVDLPLWLPGQKQTQLALSETLSAELPAYQQRLLLDASAKTRQVLWAVVLAETKTQQSLTTWQSAQELEQNVASRVKAGELAGTEGLLATSHALDNKSHYLQAKSELEFAKNNYQSLTGQNALPKDYEEALSQQASVELQHPYLAELNQQMVTLRAQQDLARFDASINPNLSVGVRRERDGHDDDFNHSVGVGISFALDNDVYSSPAIANVASELADIEIQHQHLLLELEAELLKQRHHLSSKEEQIALVIEQENTAKQYLLLQQRAFDLGEIDLVSLLRSQALAVTAQNRKASLDVSIKHAISQVNQALGILP